MNILDLRQTSVRQLEPLLEEEARHWHDELHWDYRGARRRLRGHAPRPLERSLLRALRETDLLVVRQSRRRRNQRSVPQPRRGFALPQEHHSSSRLRPIRARRLFCPTSAGRRRAHWRRAYQRSLPRSGPHHANLRSSRLSRPRTRPHAHANFGRNPPRFEIPRINTDRDLAEPLRRPALRKSTLHHHPQLHRRCLAPLKATHQEKRVILRSGVFQPAEGSQPRYFGRGNEHAPELVP